MKVPRPSHQPGPHEKARLSHESLAHTGTLQRPSRTTALRHIPADTRPRNDPQYRADQRSAANQHALHPPAPTDGSCGSDLPLTPRQKGKRP